MEPRTEVEMLDMGWNGMWKQGVEQAPAWVLAHGDVLAVARDRAGLERREGSCLLRALREDVHRHLGYGGFAEYSDRHLGYGHRTTQDKVRTAEALERLPDLARALEEGRLHASAVRELARVATPETESSWIQAAAGRRIREIERLVAGRARGDHPTDAPRPDLERHVLRFEVSGETLTAVREALQHIREQSGDNLDDDAALLLLARSMLCTAAASTGASTTANATKPNPCSGRSKYQINIIACDYCQRGFQRSGADLVEIDPAMLDAARCDAHTRHEPTLDSRETTPHSDRDSRDTTNDTDSRDTTLDDRDAIDSRGPHATHVGHQDKPARARSIPAAIRRRVLERDQHRCQIPGCRHTLDVDVHHIVPLADGGTHDPELLIAICSPHHRSVHAGRLRLTGKAGRALRVHHADGSPYGAPLDTSNAQLADVSEKVFRGLRWLGFKETEAKRALATALGEHDASAGPPIANVLLKRALTLI